MDPISARKLIDEICDKLRCSAHAVRRSAGPVGVGIMIGLSGPGALVGCSAVDAYGIPEQTADAVTAGDAEDAVRSADSPGASQDTGADAPGDDIPGNVDEYGIPDPQADAVDAYGIPWDVAEDVAKPEPDAVDVYGIPWDVQQDTGSPEPDAVDVYGIPWDVAQDTAGAVDAYGIPNPEPDAVDVYGIPADAQAPKADVEEPPPVDLYGIPDPDAG